MDAAEQLRVVIEPPTPGGGRRVRVGREILGLAHGPADVLEFCRRTGLDPDAIDLTGDLFVWHGGGPEVWPGETS
ncbi:hypothetical protein [Streptantibioticus silvisoli]|uniref:Uncharacterized protein n=1 Tax=Streptantibioticus silvisoli TaxID=2705255 RepID=A0ABT6VYJ6_9ACTN|nr:hypothetical protein [Streptantibioticus silvisoli]MDI5963556.1 hypothetical protein [Streptantibioticus silvisoli]